jgi:DmsE family decaheme c-type cytochrome
MDPGRSDGALTVSRGVGPFLAVARLFAWALLAAWSAAQTTAPFPRDGGYVGVQTCAKCHEKEHARLLLGAHKAILGSEVLPGCETCHGPGRAHADDKDNDPRAITLPAALTGAAQVKFCGRCHRSEIEHHGGDLPGLQKAGKVCTDCHVVHKKPEPQVLPGVHLLNAADTRKAAERTGSAACAGCHPLRDALLAASVHAPLASGRCETGCEDCHGNGSQHIATDGQSRLITRADRAGDGVATCRQCHAKVDPQDFHWAGRKKPYLTAGVTCTTCHKVHVAREETQQGDALASRKVLADGKVEPLPAAAAVTNRDCARCHSPASCTLPGSTHSALGRLALPVEQGCAACHAPADGGRAHLASGGRRQFVEPLHGAPAKVQAATCLSCHRDGKTLQHVNQGSHQRNGVGCLECHAPVHGATRDDVGRSAEQNCRRCHADVQAQFALPNHHPVPEGRMLCSSCHDVHGDLPRVRSLELTERRCVVCHPRYRGPFVFAHQAGRRDGCVICHLPHGTANKRLLQQANTQQNCIACHGDFPSFHDQTRGAVFTDCLRCHTEVHGSNHARFLFR